MGSEEKQKKPIATMVWVIALLTAIAFAIAGFFPEITHSGTKSGNVAVIPVHGVILSNGDSYFDEQATSSSEIVQFIEDAEDDPSIRAMVFDINSPGGSAVASQEVADAVQKSTKPTVAWIRDSGTSGAFWVATAADKVVANPMSITGSIGVTASYLQFSGLLQDYNVSYEVLTAGRLKEVGSPFKALTQEERKLFQEQLDELHTYFIQAIAANRNLSEAMVRDYATGMFFLGSKAKELGFVDVLGGKDEVKQILERQLKTNVTFFTYEREVSLFDILSRVMGKQSFSLGRGIGNGIAETNRNSKVEVRA
ncbi:signal peptide peptidase SppA [Candidatus Woesearchaeota archaeon]|nr:signal peptide peptidase SppA [Candidatus Woesearchaeota archaeon]